ncbi:MAG: hypothetical protein MI862_04880 [Desulfobacterales bacterium]|nr:hypothetical protein [Desulfobacterales bacterium]
MPGSKKEYKEAALSAWEIKIRALANLEADIEAMLKTFCETHNVKIHDIQLYDPRTCDIQFETDL